MEVLPLLSYGELISGSINEIRNRRIKIDFMQEPQTLFPRDFYAKHLSTINNIHFTPREIDVIACLLAARKTSKTAFFLSIDPRTVETHIRNIMSKLKCNTREAIIDFIETTDKLTLLRKYYTLLRIKVFFEKSLKDISKINQNTPLRCFLRGGTTKDPLIEHLKSHLNLAGITVSSAARKKEGDYLIFVLPKTLTDKDTSLLQKIIQNSNKILFLLQERRNYEKEPKEITNFGAVDFAKYENYYFSFFAILEKILPDHKLEKIISEFKDRYKKTHIVPEVLNVPSNVKGSENLSSSQTKRNLLLIFLIVGLLGSGLFVFYWNQKNESFSLQSDLVIPAESVFLSRPKLIAQVDDKLKKGDGIQTIALVGPGGSGKTTLARQYARSDKAPVIWEINAETPDGLKSSVESLAYNLSRSEEDDKTLKALQDIQEPKRWEEKILAFIKEKLRFQPHWLLIFDNVGKFSDIQPYFPSNPAAWGNGKVLLTTRDNHIQQNNQVKAFLEIGELTPEEKYDLFAKIMNYEKRNTFTNKQQEVESFLAQLPPFPLDISVAAYYLKETKISNNEYLKNLRNSDATFLTIQDDLLREKSNYTKTRYRIIVTSLKHLIDTHEDFTDLLLLVSLLDSQNIPRDLLNAHKNNLVVDSFIYNLKKYSLITSESSLFSFGLAFSIHRSTQEISMNYLFKKLGLHKNHQLLSATANTLENYMAKASEDDDYEKMKLLTFHGEKYLTHSNIIPQKIRSIIEGQLGSVYYNLSQPQKGKRLLETSLSNLKKDDSQNYDKIFWISHVLGDAYKVLGDCKKSKTLLELTWNNFKNYYSKDHISISKICCALADTYRTIGEYKNAIDFFERVLLIYRKHYPEDHKRVGRVMGFLGNAHVLIGNYQEGKSLLEKSLIIQRKHFPEDHVNIARVLKFQGILENKLGHYEKSRSLLESSSRIYSNKYSKENLKVAWRSIYLAQTYINLNKAAEILPLLEHALKIHRSFLPENQIGVGMTLAVLGDVYRTIGDYQKAKQLLKESLKIHCSHYGSSNIETARVLLSVGQVYLKEGNLEAAENQLHEVQSIFQKNNHPDIYMVYEAFSELYNERMARTIKKRDIHLLKTQSLRYLREALNVIQIHFPKDSSHMERIHGKIKKLER
ncbi:MAG: hypothetical protein BGO67_03150 [Alphaproteobacteria bacterium 41-28]|nr:MAG: hypothetical protein BGO67_03150 [Alphaproteobacteria bacterium 41-28]